MNRFVAVVHGADAPPVDAELPARLLSAISHPAGTVRSSVERGAGFAALPEAPAALGSVRGVADARLDDRAGLVEALRAATGRDLSGATDSELILHAWTAWEDGCVDRLVGDFAFVVHDDATGRLFAARDPVGAKPLFYARIAGGLVISNLLACVRAHPEVSGTLDERALGDFLLVGYNADPATTPFRDVARVPPGRLVDGTPEPRIRPWYRPPEATVSHPRADEYVAHFMDVLRLAVEDRMRDRPVAVLMSGGIDSTSVAAVAREAGARRGLETPVTAHTLILDADDPEYPWARAAADSIGVPLVPHAFGERPAFEGWASDPSPQPHADPLRAVKADLLRDLGRDAGGVLTGDGGDAVLRRATTWFPRLLRDGRFGRFTRDLLVYAVRHRSLPPLGIRARLRAGEAARAGSGLPDWIRPDFADRLDLESRRDALLAPAPADHPRRPEVVQAVFQPVWSHVFESFHALGLDADVEFRFPLLDRRLVELALAFPPISWTGSKSLLRKGLRGILSDRVLERPKTPVAMGPIREWEAASIDALEPLLREPSPADPYVDREKIATHLTRTGSLSETTVALGLLAWARTTI